MKKKSNSILFIQIYGGGNIKGGTEIYLNNLLHELNKRKVVSKIFISSFNKKNSIFKYHFCKIYDFSLLRFLDSWIVINLVQKNIFFQMIFFILSVASLFISSTKIILSNKVDLIYANGGRVSVTTAYLLSRVFKIKYVAHFHGLFHFKDLINSNNYFLRKLTIDYLKNAKILVANSNDVAKELVSVKQYHNRKIEIVNCFVNTDIFKPMNKNKCRQKLEYDKNLLIILYAIRLEKDKRLHFISDAVMQLNNPKIKLVCIGEGPYKKKLLKKIKKCSNIEYLGFIKNSQLPLYINCADISWGACSLSYLGLSAIESLACGIPVIASNVPVSNNLTQGQFVIKSTLPSNVGFLVKENINEMKKILNNLLVHKNQLYKMRRVCLNFYNSNYGDANIKKILKILESD